MAQESHSQHQRQQFSSSQQTNNARIVTHRFDPSAQVSILTSSPEQSKHPWDLWNLPSTLTDPITGKSMSISRPDLIHHLIARFFTGVSVNSIICWRTEVINRLQHAQPNALPDYLLLSICMAGAASSPERELQSWKTLGWKMTNHAVQSRLNSNLQPEMELIQALLLIATNWMGEGSLSSRNEELERSRTFELAFRLIKTLNLHSSEFNNRDVLNRSRRISLFWCTFIADKLVSVACSRRPLIQNQDHDVPMIEVEDLRGLGSMNGLICSEEDLQSFHSLTVSFISLTQILDDVQTYLYPIDSPNKTLEEVQLIIKPLEKSLENWCRVNKFLLISTSHQEGTLKRGFCQLLIGQLHLVQLQLYQPALRQEKQNSHQSKIIFSNSNSKALTGSIEAAWHHVQKSHTRSDELRIETPSQLNFETFALLRAVNFFKFLSVSWYDWNNGSGLLNWVPLASATNVPNPPPIQELNGSNFTPRNASLPSIYPRGPSESKFPERRQSMSSRRKDAPKPLDLNNPISNPNNLDLDLENDKPLPTSVFRLDTATLGVFHSFALPTPARALFDNSNIDINQPLGSIMTPLRPDFLGGIDMNIDFNPPPLPQQGSRSQVESQEGHSELSLHQHHHWSNIPTFQNDIAASSRII